MSASLHVPALGGLRGIAAAIVVVHHTFLAVDMPVSTRQAIFESPLVLLLHGQGFVQVFFVLSGYVLAGSLSRNRHRLDVVQFYVKRFFRIHPPYVFGALLAWIASAHYPDLPPGRPGLTPWISYFAAIRVDPAELLAALRFPGNVGGLLPVGWTLTVETYYSILLPAMALVGKRWLGIPLIALSVAVVCFARGMDFLWYSLSFSLGIVAFQQRERIGALFRGLHGAFGVVAMIISALVFCAPLFLIWSPWAAGLFITTGGKVTVSLTAIGAAGMVVGAVHLPWLRRALSIPPVRFLGRISYSLYLVHFTVLILCVPVVGGYGAWSDFPILLTLVFANVILLSVLSYRLVELPAIRLGNFICRGIAGRLHSQRLDSDLTDR